MNNSNDDTSELTNSSDSEWNNSCDSLEDLVKALKNITYSEFQNAAEHLNSKQEQKKRALQQKREKWKKLRKNWTLYWENQWLHRGEGDDKKIILKKWDRLNLQNFWRKFSVIPGIWNSMATHISKMKLEEGVQMFLQCNNIWCEGATALSKMKLEEGVQIFLQCNIIWDEGAVALSKMGLEEGVEIYLQSNNIWDIGAAAFIENLELKDGVVLNLSCNNISKTMEEKLKKWNQSYIDRWVNCEVIV